MIQLAWLSLASTLIAVNPSDFHWKPKEALPPGAFGAVVRGDPAKGNYDFVGKFPDRYTVPLHWHSNDCAVVMLHGSMRISPKGGAEITIQEGGFFVLPAELVYAAHCDASCTFLVHGEKPFDILYVNPEDDPRLKGSAR